MCLANNIFRDELRQLLAQNGMSYKEFEDGFSFFDEKGEKLKGKKVHAFYEMFEFDKKERILKCNVMVDGYTDFIFINRFGGVQHQGTLNKALRQLAQRSTEFCKIWVKEDMRK